MNEKAQSFFHGQGWLRLTLFWQFRLQDQVPKMAMPWKEINIVVYNAGFQLAKSIVKMELRLAACMPLSQQHEKFLVLWADQEALVSKESHTFGLSFDIGLLASATAYSRVPGFSDHFPLTKYFHSNHKCKFSLDSLKIPKVYSNKIWLTESGRQAPTDDS